MKRVPTILVGFFLAIALQVPLSVHAKEAIVNISSPPKVSLVDRASASVQDAIDHAMDLLGIRYRRGGTSPETGFDCSGFVSHVFREGMGLILPRNAKDLSSSGEEIRLDQLRPGDLVFFNTMRRAFSHVGIYLGNNQFVHAPRVGGQVRVENMQERYWMTRFNGARRLKID